MIQVVNLLRIYIFLHAEGLNLMRLLSLILRPSKMSHVREARLFKILLQIIAMWDIKNPKGWMDRLYEFYKLGLQSTILIFWGINIYLVLFSDESFGILIGNYLPSRARQPLARINERHWLCEMHFSRWPSPVPACA